MSFYFADTSAFAKRYLPEVGSGWVKSWIEPDAGNYIIISILGTVEFVSLLARRQREGIVSVADFIGLQNTFLYHTYHQYRVIPMAINVVVEARQLVARHPLRALDALQLATAIVARKALGTTITFVTADTKLLAAASLEGFTTDNPYSHP